MDPSQLQPGHRLDRYELLCPLAYGGMASVWLARFGGRLGFERLVVIKMILPQFSQDPRFQQMFFDEARIASKIEHSNVARILDVGEHHGNYFLVMEWVDGDSLSKIMRAAEQRSEPIPPGIALRIAADAAAGLYAAHELRERDGTHLAVVHRDVSPQNILIANNGATMLIDFGVAKARDRVSENTSAGQLKGKIRYMAPEQARGSAIDHRADLWALGALLYEMFSGGLPPYDAPNEVATLHLLTSGQPRTPLPPSTPPVVRRIVDRALAYAMEDRYASAIELNHALEGAMVDLNHPTSPANVARYTAELLAERKAARKRAVDKALEAARLRDTPKRPPSSSDLAEAPRADASGRFGETVTLKPRVSFPSPQTGSAIGTPANTPSQPSASAAASGPASGTPAAPAAPVAPSASGAYGAAQEPYRPSFAGSDFHAPAGLGEMPSVASNGTMGTASMEYAGPLFDGDRRRRYILAAVLGVSLAIGPIVAVSFVSSALRRDDAKASSRAAAAEAVPPPAPSPVDSAPPSFASMPPPATVTTIPAPTADPAPDPAPVGAATGAAPSAASATAAPTPARRATTTTPTAPVPTHKAPPPPAPTARTKPDRGF